MSSESPFIDKFTENLLWSILLSSGMTAILLTMLGVFTQTSILMRIAVFVFIFTTYAALARLMLICVRIVLTNMEKERK